MNRQVTVVKCEKCNKFYNISKKHICKKKDIHKLLIEKSKK